MSNAYDIPRADSPKDVGVSAKVIKSFLENSSFIGNYSPLNIFDKYSLSV